MDVAIGSNKPPTNFYSPSQTTLCTGRGTLQSAFSKYFTLLNLFKRIISDTFLVGRVYVARSPNRAVLAVISWLLISFPRVPCSLIDLWWLLWDPLDAFCRPSPSC